MEGLSKIVLLLVGCGVGFILGFLVFRNNAARIQKAEKGIIDIASKFKPKE